MPGACAIVTFARAPELGRVKTRLASELGAPAALAAYHELGRVCWQAVLAARSAPGYRTLVAFTPAPAEQAMRDWLPGADAYLAQPEGDLGRRMLAAIAAALGGGAQRVVLIGTDCPMLSPQLIAEALAALDDVDVVIGPATDGGYYLVGMSRAHAALFADVPWSSHLTLSITLERAATAGLRVAQLAPLSDVDTADDWRAWRHAVAERSR